MIRENASSFISIGGGVDLVITIEGNLYVRQNDVKAVRTAIEIGEATQNRIDEIIDNLNRIKTVCPKG